MLLRQSAYEEFCSKMRYLLFEKIELKKPTRSEWLTAKTWKSTAEVETVTCVLGDIFTCYIFYISTTLDA